MLRWVSKEMESPYGSVAVVHWAVDDNDDTAASDDADDMLLQQQLESAEDQLGAVLWNSNTVALRYLHNHVLCGKADACRVVELGAGVGCLGIALAMAGARVVVTDLKELVPLMEKNIEINASRIRSRSNNKGSCSALALRWGPPPRSKKKREKRHAATEGKGSSVYASPSPSFLALKKELDRVDIVVLCDALYGNPKDWLHLLYTLSEILSANPSCEVVNFCEQRVNDVEGDFLRLLEQENSRTPQRHGDKRLSEEEGERDDESLESALARMREGYIWWTSTETLSEETSELGMTVRATRIRWVPDGRGPRAASSPSPAGDTDDAAGEGEEPPRKRGKMEL